MDKEAKLGLFVVIVLLAFFFFTVNMGALFFTRSYTNYTVYFRNIGTLEKGAPVKQAGFDIGEVGRIARATVKKPTPEYYIVVEISVSDNAIISMDSIATIQTLGMMGEKYVEIGFGGGDPAIPLIKDGPPPTRLTGQGPQELDKVIESAAALSDDVRETVKSLNAIFGDESLQKNIIQLIANLEGFSKSLNDMIGGEQKRIEKILENIEIATAQAHTLLATAEIFIADGNSLISSNKKEIDQLISSANKTFQNTALLSDELNTNLAADLKEMSNQLKAFSVSLNESGQKATHVLAKMDAIIEENRPEINKTMTNVREITDQAKKASGRVDEILREFQEGEGLVHNLIYDKELAKNTKDTVNGASGLLSGVSDFPKKFSFVTDLRYYPDSPRFDEDDNNVRADFGIQYDASEAFYLYAGGNNLGSSNDLEAQFGYRWGVFAFHGGMIESEVGAGIDVRILDWLTLGLEGVGLTHNHKERLDAYSEIEIWDGISLVGGLQDVTDERYPNVGMIMRF
ncbi:MAG: MlaD family protein [Candidatus Omnitrophota bacterium]